MAGVRQIADAEEEFVDVSASGAAGETLRLWVRTWGSQGTGIPVLFVHGGPGNCVADYENINADFFDAAQFYVVEPDQRGTGRSEPSVRDKVENMRFYLDISLEQMSKDFEAVREHLGVEQWLVFGGSWGSTLAIDYAERFPERCLGLIVRGIFLNTPGEMDDVYDRRAFETEGKEGELPAEVLELKKRQLKEFDIFCDEVVEAGSETLSKERLACDAQALLRAYEERILAGSRLSIWKFYAFENNLMAESDADLVDPFTIDEEAHAEAQSVAFFETRLFLRGSYEDPPRLLERLGALQRMGPRGTGWSDEVRDSANLPLTWVVQGLGDAVCPPTWARVLVEALDEAGVKNHPKFVEAGHKSSSDNIKLSLQASVGECLQMLRGRG